MDLIFITGNQHKADYLAKWLGMPLAHQKIDLPEVQSLDLKEVVEDKARRAYDIVKQPVLVEDVSVTYHALGRLPGTFIKWFLEELEIDGLCTLLDGYEDRSATVKVMYGVFDGKTLSVFEATVQGHVPAKPRGDLGFGWNATFIPDGSNKTYAEMTDEELKPFSFRAQAIEELRKHLAG